MKYSVDYAEGFLEGLGCRVTNTETSDLVTFKEILKDALDKLSYDYETEQFNKVLDCVCTNEFLTAHPIN